MSSKSNVSKRIVIFEDTPENLDEFKKELGELLAKDLVEINDFDELYSDKKGRLFKETDKIHEKLRKIFEDPGTPIEMVIVDLDLSQYKDYDISEPVISDVCDSLGIPICMYSGHVDENELERIRNWSDRHIVLDSDKTILEIANQCGNIFKGFEAIKEEFKKVESESTLGPIDLISRILKAPGGAESLIVHYTTGYFSLMTQRLRDEGQRNRFFPVLLGYWIYNSVLRFPGVLLNQTAAASYLDIDVKFFNNQEIKEAFEEARYKGPFYEITPLWWKDGLDELISEVVVEGEDETPPSHLFLKQNGIDKIHRVRCEEGDHEGAGFYCIITKKPVCANHSTGNIAWLPQGAIYSRICGSKWDELGPWFGF
jgi:hypothetical protein